MKSATDAFEDAEEARGEIETLARIIEEAWGNPNYQDGDPLRPIDRTIAEAILAAGYTRQPPASTTTADASKPDCGCVVCNPGWWGMYLCSLCGNKRCPHATDHRYVCNRSNEPGQVAVLAETEQEASNGS